MNAAALACVISFGSNLCRLMQAPSRTGRCGLYASTIPNYFSPIKKLLNVNDVSVNWKRVTNTFPELDNVNKTQGWTREDIRLMLDHTKNARNRALILTLASSGVRIALDATRQYMEGRV